MKKSLLFILSVFLLIALFSCNKNPVSPDKKSDFDSPEEYLINPSIREAITESGINIHTGDNPPVLSGNYNATGKITDASSIIKELIDIPVNSIIRLYNQTASGKIELCETLENITVCGSGGYITGDNGGFTVWQESIQSGEAAGLPNDVTLYVTLLMSGNKLDNGNLQASGISIITKVETSNSSYDTAVLEGLWWMWIADLNLNGQLMTGYTNQSINEIIGLVLVKTKTDE